MPRIDADVVLEERRYIRDGALFDPNLARDIGLLASGLAGLTP